MCILFWLAVVPYVNLCFNHQQIDTSHNQRAIWVCQLCNSLGDFFQYTRDHSDWMWYEGDSQLQKWALLTFGKMYSIFPNLLTFRLRYYLDARTFGSVNKTETIDLCQRWSNTPHSSLRYWVGFQLRTSCLALSTPCWITQTNKMPLMSLWCMLRYTTYTTNNWLER